ncbi:MAG TPA: ABC transporter ATP-binding protein [Clostridiales bacterium]|nr:MAG: multidrug ABC transporter ATP-binding protein [Clostridiales bacterium GWD2_32_59]HAN10694.1 ABC transporter ATP-binding protein [Clostridiales bacterium]
MNAIEVSNLSKSYDGNTYALNDVSLAISQGEIFGFLGPNGSGKTTTIRLLNGILAKTSGNASILGHDTSSECSEIHKLCGVMTETALMYENLTGFENLNFFGNMHNMPATNIKDKSIELLKAFELADAKDKKVKTYSTGMKRRLSLARALLHSPKILFLDEPTSGLDPESAKHVTKMIHQLATEQGVTIFLCTHQLKYAEEICTLYGFIDKGIMLGFGSFDSLLKQKNSKKYLEIRGTNIPDINASIKTEEGNIKIPVSSDQEVSQIISDILSRGGKVYDARQIGWNLEDLYFSFQEEVLK